MIHIKTSSKLYKWLNYSSTSFGYALRQGRVSLCTLFWTSVLFAAGQLGVIALLAVFSISAGSLVGNLFGVALTVVAPWWVWGLHFILGLIVIALVATVAGGIAWTAFTLSNKFTAWRERNKFKRSLREEEVRTEELRLRNLYTKMKLYKREKLCPLVKVEYSE